MPKRRSENTVDILIKKLRRLEKEIKCLKRPSRIRLQSSESSSWTTSTDSTPSPDILEDRDIFEPTSPTTYAVGTAGATATGSSAFATPAPDLPPVGDTPLARAASPPAPEPAHAVTSAVGNDAPPPPQSGLEIEDAELDANIVDILGADPTAFQKYGTDINKDVAPRFNHIVTKGLDKENRKQLLETYLVPANCAHIGAPRLNLEVKAAVPDHVVRRDQAIEARQSEIAAAISCLGRVMSTLLEEKTKNHELLKRVMDAGRIMCDMQYSESVLRRKLALYSLKKDKREQLLNTKIDNLLFGEDLPETLRTAKAVTKSSSYLKLEAPKKPKPSTHAARNLNWKAGPGNSRAAPGSSRRPTPPARLQPADSRPRPANSSHGWSQRTRQTHRR